MKLVDASCCCIGLMLIALIVIMCLQNSTGSYHRLGGAQGRALHEGGQHASSHSSEEEFAPRNEALGSHFSWDPAATKATDDWNVPSIEGAKKGQTTLAGRLGTVHIRPCRLPGIDTVSALRPPPKPVTMGKACVSWGDSECRMAAIDRDTGCLDESPSCGISSR